MSAKELELRIIPAKLANQKIAELHYSGKYVRNSQVHIGVYYEGSLEGVMQFGPSLDKKKLIGLVRGTRWDGFIELNRMAFSDRLPRNSESRAIAIAMRLLRRHAPNLGWVVSFADATQCGDGTIYRASGFVLTGITPSPNLARLPDGSTIHKMTLESSPASPRPEAGGRTYYQVTGGKYNFKAYCKAVGATILQGYQLRYLYFLKPELREQMTVPSIPFPKIEEVGASMYRGQARKA